MENKAKEVKNTSKIGRFIGNVFSLTMIGCISAIMIAMTCKIITWMLF